MICERCGQREAVVNYIEIEEGVKQTQWLCESCAAEAGLDVAGSLQETELPGTKSGPLQAFLGAAQDAPDIAQPAVVCPACGYTSVQLQNTGLLGCPDCYVVFRDYLLPILRRYHRATAHLGKAPRVRGPRAELRLEIARLRHALEAAVGLEDYEEAARLRDLIRDRELELTRAARGADQES